MKCTFLSVFFYGMFTIKNYRYIIKVKVEGKL